MTRTLNLQFETKEFNQLKRAKKVLGFLTWKDMFLSMIPSKK
jgi:hypothetical protein